MKPPGSGLSLTHGGFEFGSGSTRIGLDGITVSIDYITAPSD